MKKDLRRWSLSRNGLVRLADGRCRIVDLSGHPPTPLNSKTDSVSIHSVHPSTTISRTFFPGCSRSHYAKAPTQPRSSRPRATAPWPPAGAPTTSLRRSLRRTLVCRNTRAAPRPARAARGSSAPEQAWASEVRISVGARAA